MPVRTFTPSASSRFRRIEAMSGSSGPSSWSAYSTTVTLRSRGAGTPAPSPRRSARRRGSAGAPAAPSGRRPSRSSSTGRPRSLRRAAGKGRARRDDPRPRGQAIPVHGNRVVVDEAGLPEPDLRAELAEPFRRVVLLDRVDHRADPAHDGGEGDRRKRHFRKPELLRPAGEGPDSGRPDQRLRGDAAEVEAVASQLLRLLDQDRLRAELRRSGRRRQPRRAPAEDPQSYSYAAMAPPFGYRVSMSRWRCEYLTNRSLITSASRRTTCRGTPKTVGFDEKI